MLTNNVMQYKVTSGEAGRLNGGNTRSQHLRCNGISAA